MTDRRKARLDKLAVKTGKEYGTDSVQVGVSDRDRDIVPTGSLTLDYMLGIGGWLKGQCVEVFGAPSIGKSTILGYSALRNTQRQGGLTGLIAVEPRYDEKWVYKHGIDPNYNIVGYPDTGEDAFGLLRDWVFDGTLDYILFDSVGALSQSKSLDSEKVQAFGESALITWGIKNVVMRAFKNNVGIMFINQQRDKTGANVPGVVTSPGGWAFKHLMAQRIHLRPGKDRYYGKFAGEEKSVMVGREVICYFEKNNLAESLGKDARFDFYHIDHPEFPFGIDEAKDIINVAKLTKVFTGGNWLQHHSFPGGKLNGKAKVAEFFHEHPEAIDVVRQEVLAKMAVKEAALEDEKEENDDG